jgi:phage terminase small subunit
VYGYLDELNTIRIQNADIVTLDDIAKTEYRNLNIKERKFSELILNGVNEHKAVKDAGYSLNNLYNIVSQNRKKTSLCLYISAKQELELRKNKAELQANVDMIGDALKYLHQVLTYEDPEGDKKQFKPDENKIIAAREILKVLKPDQSTGKNKAFSIKKPENMQNSEHSRDNKSNNRKISIDSTKQNFGGVDED